MIITCTNCNKKFEIDSELIPVGGILLECSKCNNQWFFKKETFINEVKPPDEEDKKIDQDYLEKNNLAENQTSMVIKEPETENIISVKNNHNFQDTQEDSIKEKIDIKIKSKTSNINILNLILVFIISLSGLIILIDTFKAPISLVIPNIELILYNLLETFKDIILFLKDLI